MNKKTDNVILIEDPRRLAESFAEAIRAELKNKTSIAAGKAIAAVLRGVERADVSDADALSVLENYKTEPDEAKRNAALRAGVRAMLDELVGDAGGAGDFIPRALAAEVIVAFNALDAGMTPGLTTRAKNSRRAGAADYDELALAVAGEACFATGLYGLKSRERALATVTGIARPGAAKTSDPSLRTIPLIDAGVSWKQLRLLDERGVEKLKASGQAEAIAAGQAAAAGGEPEPSFAGWRAHWLRVASTPETLRAALNIARAKSEKGEKP